MNIPTEVQKLAEAVFEEHEGGDTVGYMVAAIMADRETRDLHEETERFLRVAIDRSPEPLRQLGEYLANALNEDQFPRADRLMLGIAEEQKKRAESYDDMSEALSATLASLVAAVSIICKADSAKVLPSYAVGSQKMFVEMLRDYDKAATKGRAALLIARGFAS
jgi:uncharacterized Ntn-hydrolase superfamily protein